jgi:serine phosphatase RsbU (regulator of sigma subunit)
MRSAIATARLEHAACGQRIPHSADSKRRGSAPYLNGKEMAVEGALPLGAIPGAKFPALRFQLDEGDSLVLITDGVVEARSKTGELFGFELTAAISTQSADQIAQAAQAHGQDDDITVLTLARA